jgi:hypothetical protein
VTKFLRDALAADAVPVPELDEKARAKGLLSEREAITKAKVFKRAKKSLGITSRRRGFGARSRWLWEMPRQQSEHRWRQFAEDCKIFVSSPESLAERASRLGWDAMALFGCAPKRPLDYSGSAGLLWAINGGSLVELHRDWAVIDLPVNRSQRIFYRRNVDPAKITLPWVKQASLR